MYYLSRFTVDANAHNKQNENFISKDHTLIIDELEKVSNFIIEPSGHHIFILH